MKITQVVSEVEMQMEESQNQRDKRVEELWRKLDPQAKGELDLKGLQRGLRKIDHPMKNADRMLEDIMRAVDTNGDGKIQYEEFRVFVEQAERHLLMMFRSIDCDHDGRLGQEELQAAFQRAGLAVPSRRLSGFFDEIDMNHDGYISFEEWRNFLLFMPPANDRSTLEAALSYYSSIVTLNAEGDSMVSEETLEGLGTTGFLLQALFGSILKIAQPNSVDPYYRQASIPQTNPASTSVPQLSPEATPILIRSQPVPAPHSTTDLASTAPMANGSYSYDHLNSENRHMAILEASEKGVQGLLDHFGDNQPLDVPEHPYAPSHSHTERETSQKLKLTQYLPEPGYFLAGALAGGISRTATAPLDRLKVYLLVNTRTVHPAAKAVKNAQPMEPLKRAGHPISEAVRRLYRQGGIRNFFAGNGLNVVKIMPETAIKFGTYEFAKRSLANFEGHGDPSQLKPSSKFVAGGLAGMMAQCCVYPLDTLKFRMQCETRHDGLKGNALIMETAKKLYQAGGVRAAYRGITMGLMGMFPYSAIDMGTFELLKKTFTKYKARHYGIHEEDASPGNVATGIIGATSGAFGATMVYPLNVLRTRLQTQGTHMHPPTYDGIIDVAQKTFRNEGVRGLYKGLTPNLLKVAPALSITWIVYENSKKLLKLH